MAKKELESWTIAELEAELLKLQEEQHAIRERMRRLVAVRDAKAVQEAAVRKFDDLPPAEREAMARHITAQGIAGEGSG